MKDKKVFGGEEGRVTGVEEQVRGAEGGDVSESNQPSASNSIGDPDRGSKHRKSGYDPDWLKKPKYSQWLYQTQHGKLQFVVIRGPSQQVGSLLFL